MRPSSRLPFPLSALVALFLSSCLLGPQAKRGSIVDNELGLGRIYLANGNPAVNALVRIIPVGHIPDTLGDSANALPDGFITRTDSAGAYRVDSLSKGEYNILAKRDDLAAFQDSVYLDTQALSIPPDTLHSPGSLSGVVALQPNHDPQSCLVQLLGTTSYANVGPDGRFTLPDLGGGKYTLRVITSYSEYNTLVKGVTVIAGRSDTLADTLRPVFLGIPVVQGLSASYDTLSTVVTLTWSPAHYRDFSEYLIYRDTSPALQLSADPIGLAVDTLYRDSLLGAAGGFDSSDQEKKFEYRVRIQNKSDQRGLTYGKVVVTAVPPDRVRTRIQLAIASVAWDAGNQGDSIAMTANLANTGRKIAWMQWSVGADTLARQSLGGVHDTTERLAFLWTKQEDVNVSLIVADEAGVVDSSSVLVRGNHAPHLQAIADTTIKTYLDWKLQAIGTDPDGDTLRYAIHGKPAWAKFDSSTGILSGTPGLSDTGTFAGITVEVSDGRRTAVAGPFRIRVIANPWSPGPAMPPSVASSNGGYPSAAVTIDGKMYFVGDSLWVYEPANQGWKGLWELPLKTVRPDIRMSFSSAAATKGKIALFVCDRDLWPQGATVIYTRVLDPVSGSLAELPPDTIEAIFDVSAGAVVDGIFYSISNGKVWSYDLDSNTWTQKKSPPDGLNGLQHEGACAVVNGKILIVGQNDYDGGNTFFRNAGAAALYDPVADQWTSLPSIKPRTNGAITVINGKVYYAGGFEESPPFTRVEAFDPALGKWIPKAPLPESMGAAPGAGTIASAQLDGKWYLLFGRSDQYGQPGQYDKQGGTVTKSVIYDPALDP